MDEARGNLFVNLLSEMTAEEIQKVIDFSKGIDCPRQFINALEDLKKHTA